MLESRAIDIIRQRLIANGCKWVRKNHGNMYSQGRTDLEFLSPTGAFYALEVKRGVKELANVTALQWQEIKAINEAGGRAWAGAIELRRNDMRNYYLMHYVDAQGEVVNIDDLDRWCKNRMAL